jgi:hypothetical protein
MKKIKNKIRKILCKVGLHKWKHEGLQGIFLNPVGKCKYCHTRYEDILLGGARIIYEDLKERSQ